MTISHEWWKKRVTIVPILKKSSLYMYNELIDSFFYFLNLRAQGKF